MSKYWESGSDLVDDWYADVAAYAYDGDCDQEGCTNSVYSGRMTCQDCREELERADLIEFSDTKGQRREQRRQRDRMGMVKHLEGTFRPIKMPSPKIRGAGRKRP